MRLSKGKDFFPKAFGAVMLLMMFLAATFIKENDIERVSGARNLEASYHVLLTIESLRQNELSDHWLLPTVSFARKSDKFVSWGATVSTASGNAVYTSFTPPGFLVPYGVFQLFNLRPTISNLARFNMAVGGAAAIALYLLILKIAAYSGFNAPVTIAAALAAMPVAFFSRESLASTGIIYWPHAFYQILLLVSLLLLFNALKNNSIEQRKSFTPNLLLAFLFLGAWTEWTGYIFNIGLFFVFWYGLGNKMSRVFALKILFVTISAGVFTILHYGLAVGFSEGVRAFARRFLARSASSGSLSDLIGGYGLSYGAFFLLVLAILFCAYIFKSRNITGSRNQITSLVLFAAAFPLMENIIMVQHATEFSFDRLKYIAPAALIIALAFCNSSLRWRMVIIGIVGLASVNGYKTHKSDMKKYAAWASYEVSNNEIVARLRDQVDFECATFASNMDVRGYANLLIGRAIHERKSFKEAIQLTQSSGGCATVYLEGDMVYQDLPRYTRTTIQWPDGRSTILKNEKLR